MAIFDLSKVRVAGSADEVREVGIDPRHTFVCGPERPGFRPCPLWETCEQPEKHKQGFVTWTKDGAVVKPLGPGYANLDGAVREGPGPLNLGIRRTKIIGGTKFRTVNATCRCWEYPYQKAKWLTNNEGGKPPVALIQVIAIEGQTINLPGSLPKVQDDLKVIHEVQKTGVPMIIPPFVRPRDNEDFAASVMTMAEINREAAQQRGTTLREFVKINPEDIGDDADLTLEGGTPNPGSTGGGASSRG